MAAIIDEEVKALVDNAYARCRDILTQQRPALDLVARYLLEFETMDAAAFQRVFTEPEALEAELAAHQKELAEAPPRPGGTGGAP